MDFAPRGSTPDKTIPRFHVRPVEMPFKSKEAGRPVFEDREFVEIITPGMPKSMPVEPVNDEHKARWPQQYEAFLRGKEAPTSGTPLEEWQAISASTALNMKSLALRTVEDLATASDAVIQNLQGGHDLRRRAQAFLEQAQGAAPLERALSELEAATAKIAVLEGQVRDLADMVRLYEEEAAAEDGQGEEPRRTRRKAA